MAPTQAAYIPFDEESADPVDSTIPPEIVDYVTQEQWSKFCDFASRAVTSITLEYRIIFYTLAVLCLMSATLFIVIGGFWEAAALLLTGICLLSPLTKTIYTRPRLWSRMTKLCKDVSDKTLPGVILHFKKDKGHIVASEPGFSLKEEVENYFIDIWLVRRRRRSSLRRMEEP